jgi:hypothetical protein
MRQLREEVGRLSLDAMIDTILSEETAPPQPRSH